MPGSGRWCRSIAEARQAFASGKLTPDDLLESCLSAADKTEGLNAFSWRADADVLRRQASAATQRWKRNEPRGVLDGVPVSIKDAFCWKPEGVAAASPVTACGSSMLAPYAPPCTATTVKRLESAGASVVGKTNLDEFAMGSGGLDSVAGPVKSPWRSGQDHYELLDGQNCRLDNVNTTVIGSNAETGWTVAGGSSGGSAASVSAGACLASLGSDTGGSTRIPGSWCGLPTLKPTYGALSRHGLVPLVNPLDCPALMARTVEDLALCLAATLGPDPADPTTLDAAPDVEHALMEADCDPDISGMTVSNRTTSLAKMSILSFSDRHPQRVPLREHV